MPEVCWVGVREGSGPIMGRATCFAPPFSVERQLLVLAGEMASSGEHAVSP